MIFKGPFPTQTILWFYWSMKGRKTECGRINISHDTWTKDIKLNYISQKA